jgi:hypothetical protein
MRYFSVFLLIVSLFIYSAAFASYVFVSDEESGIYVIDTDKIEIVKHIDLKGLGLREAVLKIPHRDRPPSL